MRKEKLSELLDISIGRTPSRNEPAYWGEGHRWVSIRDLSSKTVAETKEQITEFAVKEARCKIVKKGTLLFSFKLTIGKMAFAGCDLFTNEAIAAFSIKDKRKLNSEFLYYALQSATFGGSNQAVMGKTLNLKSLAEIKIPLPPLDDQKRIAHLLGKVEGMIARRKQHLQQLDELLKSVFLEMFGDPVRNEKGWEIVSLIEYGQFKNGLNFSKGESGVKVLYLGVGDFQSHSKISDTTALSEINLESLPAEGYFLKDGDIVFVRSNGNKELVGRCIVIYPGNSKVTYSGFCIRYRLDKEELNPTYLAHLFRADTFKRTMLQNGRGANIQNINQQLLNDLKIPKPDVTLQNQFAVIVTKVESLKSRYQSSLSNLENLYCVLSQKAFKGELDLGRVPFPVDGE
jgi:type I restriction enzyme, S subunit